LYQKKKRNSAKKKTPGKKKTPKSAKRQQLEVAKALKPSGSTTTIVTSSKRALFTSPHASRSVSDLPQLARSSSSRQLPKRSLFSPAHKRKRSSSPDQDVENRLGKNRRLDSPSILGKSKSFSIAPTSSTGCLDDHYRKTLYYRTQSEMVLNQSSSDNKGTNNLGFRKSFSELERKVNTIRILITLETTL
jgi:hypothetical protein